MFNIGSAFSKGTLWASGKGRQEVGEEMALCMMPIHIWRVSTVVALFSGAHTHVSFMKHHGIQLQVALHWRLDSQPRWFTLCWPPAYYIFRPSRGVGTQWCR